MKWRRYIGVDLHDKEIRVAALRRRWRKGGQLIGQQVLATPGSLGPAAEAQPGATYEPAQLASLRDTLMSLALREQRVAVSLPDRFGYVLLLEIDSFSRSRREGREVVAWQIGNLLPGLSDPHFDFQVLRRSPGGAARVLVVAIEREVLRRYENLLQQTGFVPGYVGFYGLNLYRFWRYRLDPDGDAVLVSINEDGVILQSYRDGVLDYYRARAVGGQVSHQVQELHRIVAGGGQEFAGRGRFRIFLHVDQPLQPETEEALNECFGRKVQVLEGHGGCSPALAAAVGAAERLMMGG